MTCCARPRSGGSGSLPEPVKTEVRSNWSNAVLVCAKCSKRVGGGFGPKRRTALSKALRRCAPELDTDVAHGLLDLAVHWLSPARVGATIVVHEQGFEWAAMDVATKFRAPKLSLRNRQHYPALFASLQQHDLATLVTADGSVEYLGVGLRSSEEAERNVDSDRGMRHRSAQRFSYDHPSTTIAVVSDSGPVTIFRGGRAIGLSANG